MNTRYTLKNVDKTRCQNPAKPWWTWLKHSIELLKDHLIQAATYSLVTKEANTSEKERGDCINKGQWRRAENSPAGARCWHHINKNSARGTAKQVKIGDCHAASMEIEKYDSCPVIQKNLQVKIRLGEKRVRFNRSYIEYSTYEPLIRGL